MHTPGPWTVGENRSVVRLIFGPYQGRIADVHWYGNDPHIEKIGPDKEECYANARLIAAAPELLDALKEAVQDCGCSIRERDSGHKIGCRVPEWQEIIRKIEGD